jgi:hypothetical protein
VTSIYFLAEGDAEAVRLALDFRALLTADHVPAHDMITVPHLTSLPDLAEGVPVSVDLSVITQIWPTIPEDPESDLSWMAEPIIERIADPQRDRVAAIHPDRVPEVIEAWTAELGESVSEGSAGQLAVDLIQLAQRGQDHHLGLYNWYEL